MKKAIIIIFVVLSIIAGYLIFVEKKLTKIINEKQIALDCAVKLYNDKKQNGMEFDSQCLGTCGNYAVDIVHVPRISEDNLVENQCEDYRAGKVSHFIEINRNGEVVRII